MESLSEVEILKKQLAEECAQKYKAYIRIQQLEVEIAELKQKLLSVTTG